MILDIIQKYSDIIESYDILKFRSAGSSYQLVCKIEMGVATLGRRSI
ncbi:Uncharacterized protein dnm_057320 [Desulfonema magnum]|uniref:Uncharacterized protein n=1 Tax=Desulfonema magnum TaxID=45655 RepID=A0A975BQG2_9BACT|nr:Uncharacterized protein dnm_057320 [Desulfonema magnum]